MFRNKQVYERKHEPRGEQAKQGRVPGAARGGKPRLLEEEVHQEEDVVLFAAIAKSLNCRGETKCGQTALTGVFCHFSSLLASAGSTDTTLST